MRAIYSILTLACLMALSACSPQPANKVLTIGFNPAESADVVEANATVLSKILKEKAGVELKTFVASDFGALIEAMRAGRVDIGFLPPFSYVLAEKVANAKVLLKAVRNGHAHFYGAIITAKDYKKLEDLKGKTIAWTDPSSSSGHIVPKYELLERGIDPDKFFSKQVFAGGHDALVLAVANKTVDAGATFVNDPSGKDSAWQLFLKDPAQVAQIRMLMITKPIPGDTMCTTQKFYAANTKLVDKITKIMLDLGKTPEGSKVLRELYRIDSMVVAKPEDYDSLRAAARRLGIGEIQN